MDPVQEQIIADFAIFDDPLDKAQYLIELGDAFHSDPMIRNERYSMGDACQSRAWLVAKMSDDGRVWFSADSDASIPKGIVALLVKALNGRTPREILDTDLYFIDRVGLREFLTPKRANGLAAMLKQMKLYALAFDSKTQKQ